MLERANTFVLPQAGAKLDFQGGLVSEQNCLLWNGSRLILDGGERVQQEPAYMYRMRPFAEYSDNLRWADFNMNSC